MHAAGRSHLLPEELRRLRAQIDAKRDPDLPEIETAAPPRLPRDQGGLRGERQDLPGYRITGRQFGEPEDPMRREVHAQNRPNGGTAAPRQNRVPAPQRGDPRGHQAQQLHHRPRKTQAQGLPHRLRTERPLHPPRKTHPRIVQGQVQRLTALQQPRRQLPTGPLPQRRPRKPALLAHLHGQGRAALDEALGKQHDQRQRRTAHPQKQHPR